MGLQRVRHDCVTNFHFSLSLPSKGWHRFANNSQVSQVVTSTRDPPGPVLTCRHRWVLAVSDELRASVLPHHR